MRRAILGCEGSQMCQKRTGVMELFKGIYIYIYTKLKDLWYLALLKDLWGTFLFISTVAFLSKSRGQFLGGRLEFPFRLWEQKIYVGPCFLLFLFFLWWFYLVSPATLRNSMKGKAGPCFDGETSQLRTPYNIKNDKHERKPAPTSLDDKAL